ncbi:putative tetraacyldisaccharide 4'-kinase, mitochondrial [Dorcoceras hygrometricum]|uniref:Putative tetraacyldisaccharide 4'-kinase, mitochondrial n=1 Tax=Dorcoceras hygrometricum TaxID=472368 RepID=A0A2Z7BYB4_9LAMI|nr:putative tetraacyldisaccharide 4'-kinase, mitochondrial [Dorcoceras hygrometricum]
MPPKRREQTDKNKEDDNMPELEELQAADDNQRRISVQGMLDRIEGQSHGQPVAKRPAVPHEHTPDKDVADLEEASKVMAEGILVYVKAVVSHITQSTNQRNFQHKEPKQGVGSSGAGETHRSIPTPSILEERYTSPHRREETVFQRSPANVRGNENGNPRPHLHQLYNATNPVNQPDLCEEGDVYHRMSWAYQREEENCLKLQPVSTHKMHGYSKKNESTMKTQRVRAAGHHDRPRFVLPPRSDVSDAWRIAQHKKFPKSLTRTQKRRMLRQRASAKPKTTENTVSKSKSCIKATEDKSSKDGDDLLSKEDAQENRTIDFSVGKFHISVDCNTEVGYGGADEAKMLQRHLQGTCAKIGIGANQVAIASRFLENYGYVNFHLERPFSLEREKSLSNSDHIAAAILDDGLQVVLILLGVLQPRLIT